MSALSDRLLHKYKGKLPKDYVLAISELSEKKESRRFLNDSDVHAQLLIETMIGNATQSDDVRIYSGELRSRCYSDVLNLTKGSVRILVDDLEAGRNVVNSLNESQRDRISLRSVPSGNISTNHFYTVGTRSFRYEIDHGLATAVANFNEPETVSKLNHIFDDLWAAADKLANTSTPVPA